LASVRPPRRLFLKSPSKATQQHSGDEFFTNTLPLIGGAVLWQAGIAAAVVRSAALAAVLVACGSAVFAWLWTSGLSRPKRPASRKGVAVTLLLAIVMTVLQYQAASTPPTIASDETKPIATPLVGGQIDSKDIKPLPGKGLVPGVILKPETKPQKIDAHELLPASRHGILQARPFVLNFTGEYHLFPSSSGRVQPDSTVLKGTPLDALYASMSGGTIQTEAFQPIHPPIDLTNCGRIQVSLKTAEQSPGSATLHLITTTGSLELGTEIFGMEASRDETLEFTVPAPPADLRVRAIRVVFQRDPMHRTESTKAAVAGFTFFPRIL
jgi:hypothetical protein